MLSNAIARKDTYWVAFHLLPQDDCTDVLGEGRLLRGGVWNKHGNAGHLPLFACGVISGSLPLAQKAGLIPKSSRGLFIL